MRTLLSILFILTIKFSNSQRLHDYYVAVPSDSLTGGILKFVDGSTVELSSFPRHMSRQLKVNFKYISTTNSIDILSDDVSINDRTVLKNYELRYFIRPKYNLTIIDNGLIDENNSLIYIRGKDFEKNHKLTYIINGKTYIQNMGITDSYGIVHKSSGNSKKLQRALDSLKSGDFSLQMFRGFEAYNKFGYKKVFGVIVINSKE